LLLLSTLCGCVPRGEENDGAVLAHRVGWSPHYAQGNFLSIGKTIEVNELILNGLPMLRRKSSVFLILMFCFLASCQKQLPELSLKGALTAKNLVSVEGAFPCSHGALEYSWYLSSSPDGEWERLEGLRTDEIVLLTSYVGKYIKCEIACLDEGTGEQILTEIISSQPVEYKGNPNTDWFRDAGYGIMVHYLKPAIVPDGGAAEWNAAVDSFEVGAFARQASDAGAGFVMFTLGQNSGYYCSPNTVYDRTVGVDPGTLCSTRDLPADLASALKEYGIPLILYLPSNPPQGNEMVSEKLRYSYKKDSATSQYNQPILEAMIREWSMRYGKDVKGWWFDGLYDWNGIRSTRLDMSLSHNISTHTLAAKAGNRNSIVTYNSGFGKIRANTPYCDYTSGEKSTIDEFPEGRWVEDGVQWFLFTYLGEKWGGKGRQFETDSLVQMARRIVDNDGVLCLEVVTGVEGRILSHHLEQIKAVGRSLGRVQEQK
jgi:hypothetical protein